MNTDKDSIIFDREREPADLVVSLEGFEGPIDLLLSLARDQKVDLCGLAILPLAEQYLRYISEARRLHLEVAADYLVMAAWLAFLKSRLLLPAPEQPAGESDPVLLADALRFQLQRLEAMQKAAKQIQERPQLGVDVFMRGVPEAIDITIKPIYFLPIHDLLNALCAPLRRRKPPTYSVSQTRLYSLEESVTRLRRLMGYVPSWSELEAYLPAVLNPEEVLEARSALASTFAATLELVKSGELELRQDGTYAPIYVRRRQNTEEQTSEK